MSGTVCRACGDPVEVIVGREGAYHCCRSCGAVGWDHPNRSLYFGEESGRLAGHGRTLEAPTVPLTARRGLSSGGLP